MIKTPVVELSRHHSRTQPEINVRIAKAARDHGIGMTDKTIGFLQESIGVKVSNRRNTMHTHGKVRASIHNIAERRADENCRQHNRLTRSAPDYVGDIEWEQDGVKHSTCQSSVCNDGAGAKRSYGNKHTRSQSASITTSALTKKPLCLAHGQVSHVMFIVC